MSPAKCNLLAEKKKIKPHKTWPLPNHDPYEEVPRLP